MSAASGSRRCSTTNISLMTERLAAKRGENTRFFVFADTIAAKSYTRKDNWHGWMGIRFQNRPGAEPSQILLHVSLLDRETTLQQEAVGILGVNLIHAALYEADPVALVQHLLDSLSSERIEVDLIEFSGPAFAGVDNRLMSLRAGPLRPDRRGHVHGRGEGRPAGRGVLQAADPGPPRPVPAGDQPHGRHAPLRPEPVPARAGQSGREHPGRRRDDPPPPPARRRHRRPATTSIASTCSGRSAAP